MIIDEILEVHELIITGNPEDDPGAWGTACSGCNWVEPYSDAAPGLHIQHVAKVLELHMREREAKAWQTGVGTALNHAILNPDGITLRLEHLDGKPWANPYTDSEPLVGAQDKIASAGSEYSVAALRANFEWGGRVWQDPTKFDRVIDKVRTEAKAETLSRLERAERELVAVKSTQVQHIVTTSFESARNAGIALDEAVKVVAGWLVNDPDKRAREAEQQVARVRKMHRPIPVKVNFDEETTDFCKRCYEDRADDAEYPCATIRALDGEQ